LFFLEGGASVSQQTLSTEQSSAASDQETVQVYRVSPILRSRLGSDTLAEMRYIFSEVVVSGDDASDETGHIGAVTVSGVEDPLRLRWTAGGRTGLQLRSDDGDIMRNDAEIGAEFALTRPIHPIGAVGYQTFNEEGGLDFESPSWRAGARFFPNRRLDFSADYGLRDDRYSPAFRLRYEPGPRTNVFASYSEALGTAQQRLAGTLGFIAIDPETGEFIDDRAGTVFDPRTDPFDIDDDTSRVKLLTALLTHDWRRTTVTLRAGGGTEEEVETGDEEDVLSFDIGLQRRLSRWTSLETGFGYIATDFADGQDDDEYFILGGLRHRLGRSLSAFAGYGYRWQNSSEPTDEYKEHRVGVGFFMEF
ncbi:MAG TPA: outer membrane beta-barrel protein, partial [Alphaproteobacteria bacterium]|nr:outer membrane beta-barrel protein [Alphaproteobacteria bacterium]